MPNRVAIIANTLVEPGMSGGNRIFIEGGKRWLDKGTEVDVFTSDVGMKVCRDNGLIGARYFAWSVKTYARLGVIAMYGIGTLRALLNGLQISTRGKTVAVYSSSDFWPDSIAAIVAKLRDRKLRWAASFYLFAQSPWSKEFRYARKESLKGLLYWFSQIPIFFLVRKFADVVFVTNEPDRGKFIGSRLKPEEVMAVRGGVDARVTGAVPEALDKTYDAVFLGRFHPQKGVLELIEIWKVVCDSYKDARLAIIGIGMLEGRMRRRIKELGLENQIDLLGFKDGIEKVTILKRSKIGLYPATLDHWSMAPVELMVSGLPVVTFDVPTLKSLNPKGMIRVPCYDLHSFASSVIRLIHDQDLYERTRDEALVWASEWDWGARADMMLERIIG